MDDRWRGRWVKVVNRCSYLGGQVEEDEYVEVDGFTERWLAKSEGQTQESVNLPVWLG